jgi:hypothetical protein
MMHPNIAAQKKKKQCIHAASSIGDNNRRFAGLKKETEKIGVSNGVCAAPTTTRDRSRLLLEVEAVAERARPCCEGEISPRKKNERREVVVVVDGTGG